MNESHNRRGGLTAGLLLALLGTALVLVLYAGREVKAESSHTIGSMQSEPSGWSVYLPVVATADTGTPIPDPLCRAGVNVVGRSGSLERFDIAPLRIGWYIDYYADIDPPRPNGIEYLPVLAINQIGDNGYDITPKKHILRQVAQAQPGALWLIGNEPDRRVLQNDLEPHIYAMAYHDMYTFLKGVDPTARIIAGTIVQPTELRLRYLDLVLEAYRDLYGAPMPVDGWSIHNFILNEVSCDYDPANCWGAGIPPGMDDPFGEIIGIDDNDNFDMFKERIRRFRQWMADKGYRGYPLYLTEYGILMPEEYGFDATRVNTYMTKTFDYMLNATDPVLGDPLDGNRLIQRWSWYSTSDQAFNGWLFDAETTAISPMGQHYADLTSQIPDVVELSAAAIETVPATILSSNGQPVTVKLRAVVANAGHLIAPTTAKVRFFNGNPAQGGTKIGMDQTVSLEGCGTTAVAEVTWSNVPPGAHQVYIVVDPQNSVAEPNEGNNTRSRTIVVATEWLHLPNVTR